MKKIIALLMVFGMCIGLVACGSKTDDSNSGKNNKDGVTEIKWWTSYGQANMEYMNDMIEKFNEIHSDEYYVTLVNQGSNGGIRTQLASTKKTNLPSMYSGPAIAIGSYAGTSFTAPIQKFIDADEEDWTSGTYENVISAYSDKDGNLIGWPMGVSSAGWFVNVEALNKAGYQVSDLTSLEKLSAAAKAMVKGGYVKYGISFNGGVDLLDLLTLQGIDIVDAGNGYNGNATKCLFKEGNTNTMVKKVMGTVADLYKSNVAFTASADINADLIPLFVQRGLGMYFATNSYAYKLISMGPEFEWAFIPSVGIDDHAKYKGYALSEGTGTFICDTGNEAEMQGAYELIKFLANVENQTYWCQRTGYIPYTQEAGEQAEYAAWVKENFPTLENTKNLLLSSPGELKGPYTGVASQLESSLDLLITSAALNPDDDFDIAIEEAAEQVDEAIEAWLMKQ